MLNGQGLLCEANKYPLNASEYFQQIDLNRHCCWLHINLLAIYWPSFLWIFTNLFEWYAVAQFSHKFSMSWCKWWGERSEAKAAWIIYVCAQCERGKRQCATKAFNCCIKFHTISIYASMHSIPFIKSLDNIYFFALCHNWIQASAVPGGCTTKAKE